MIYVSLYFDKKIIDINFNIIGTIEYKMIIAIVELSFMFVVSKEVNSKVINEIATANANENFVIIAQKANKIPEISLFIFFTLLCNISLNRRG